jgi:superoxide dismutase
MKNPLIKRALNNMMLSAQEVKKAHLKRAQEFRNILNNLTAGTGEYMIIERLMIQRLKLADEIK